MDRHVTVINYGGNCSKCFKRVEDVGTCLIYKSYVFCPDCYPSGYHAEQERILNQMIRDARREIVHTSAQEKEVPQ